MIDSIIYLIDAIIILFIKNICISQFLRRYIWKLFVFEEFSEKLFLFVFVIAYWKNSVFKYKYILFKQIKFIWSLFLKS